MSESKQVNNVSDENFKTIDFSIEKTQIEYDSYNGGQRLGKAIEENKFPSKQKKTVWFGLDFWEGFADYCEKKHIVFAKDILEKFATPMGSGRAYNLDNRLIQLYTKK